MFLKFYINLTAEWSEIKRVMFRQVIGKLYLKCKNYRNVAHSEIVISSSVEIPVNNNKSLPTVNLNHTFSLSKHVLA